MDQILEPGAGLDATGRRLLLDRLIAAESSHEAAEELAFWPAVRRRASGGRKLADEGRRQEGDGKYQLDALRFVTDQADLDGGLREAAALLRRHIDFEEQEVWPVVRRASGPIGAHLLGLKYRAAVRATPTRPHPHGPDGPMGLSTVGLAAAATDRIRDRLSGRHRRLSGRLGSPEGEPDAIGFLAGEHRRIDGLLRRVETSEWPDAALLHDVVRELSVHDAIERQFLYPVARSRLSGGNDLFDHALSEHGRIASALAEVDRRPDGDSRRREQAKRVVKLVRAHVAEEEGQIFPALRAHLGPQELVELGESLRAAQAGSPTRPHPHAGGAGVGARLARVVAGPLDRARDALAGRH